MQETNYVSLICKNPLVLTWPGLKVGQSAEKEALHPLSLCRASVTNRTNISPLDAVSVSLGAAVPVNPVPECRRSPEVLEPSNTCETQGVNVSWGLITYDMKINVI